jgi:uncharacterized alpha-E superfamily protein
MRIRIIEAALRGTLYASRMKRLPLWTALSSELTFSERGDNVTRLLNTPFSWHHRSFTVSANAYSVSLLNFMSGMFVNYRHYRRVCGPRFASRGLMPANLEGFAPQQTQVKRMGKEDLKRFILL